MIMALSKRRKYKIKYRSTFEEKVTKELTEAGVGFKYEAMKITYQKKPSAYTPDLILENGIIVEIKGFFDSEDRAKHLLIKEQHPELEIKFLFQKSLTKIRKGSKTSYGDWCEQHGFDYAEGTIPDRWLVIKDKE